MDTQINTTRNKENKGVVMNISIWGIVGIMLMFLVIIGTGFWMSSGGKPYNTGVFTLHKLISIAAVAILAVITIKTNKASGLKGYELAGIIVTGVLLLGTIVAGGILSVSKNMPVIILRMHQVLPFLTTVSSAISLFLLK